MPSLRIWIDRLDTLCFSPFQRIYIGVFSSGIVQPECCVSCQRCSARHSHHQCLLYGESPQLGQARTRQDTIEEKGSRSIQAKRKRAAIRNSQGDDSIVSPVAAAVHPFGPDVRFEVEGDDPHAGDDALQVDNTRRTLDEAVHGGRVIYVPCHRSPTKTCGQVSSAMGIMAASQRVEIPDLQRTLGGGDRAGLLARCVRVVGRTPPPGRDPGATCVCRWQRRHRDGIRTNLTRRRGRTSRSVSMKSMDLSMVCVRCHGATSVV